MRFLLFISFLSSLTCSLLAQKKYDSLTYNGVKSLNERAKIVSEELAIKRIEGEHITDSIRIDFNQRLDSVQNEYRGSIGKLDSVKHGFEHQLDSVRKMGQYVDKQVRVYEAKLDSVTRAKTHQVAELNQKVESAKAKAKSSLDQLNMSAEMRGPVEDLKKSIGSYSIPMVNGKIPTANTSIGKLPGFNLPQANLQSNNGLQLPGTGANDPLAGVTKETQQLSTVTNQAGTYTKDIKSVTTGNLQEVKTLDKKLEGEAMNMKGTEELKSKTAELEKYKKQMDIKPDSVSLENVKEEVTKQFTRDAVNHFAGQQVLLQDAMGKMDKYKKKYKDVKNIAELPKRLPNPLRGMPFIERLMPGLSLQIFNRNGLQSDVNAYAVYQFTPRFSSGIGWVERISFSDKATSQLRVYGPRAAFRMDWTKGITFTVQPELLNTYIQPQFINVPGITEGRREWVWSGMVTVRKSFRFRKNINAFTELLYNFHNPQNKSPYPDPLMMRFGFEFKLHKRQSR